jgi:hypothetical protein
VCSQLRKSYQNRMFRYWRPSHNDWGGCGGGSPPPALAPPAAPRDFAINVGVEAQASSRWSAASARASAPTLMSLRVSTARPVQAPAPQQRQVTSLPLPCGPTMLVGGHTRRSPVFGATQTCCKFRPEMGRTGHVGSVASHWIVRNWRAGLVRPDHTRADAMRRYAGIILIAR